MYHHVLTLAQMTLETLNLGLAACWNNGICHMVKPTQEALKKDNHGDILWRYMGRTNNQLFGVGQTWDIPHMTILIRTITMHWNLGTSFSDQKFFQLSTHHLRKMVGLFLILLEHIQGRPSMKKSSRRRWMNTRRQNTQDILKMTGRKKNACTFSRIQLATYDGVCC